MNDFDEHVFGYDELIYSTVKLNQFLYAERELCIAKLKKHAALSNTLSIFELKKKNHLFEIQKRQNVNSLHPLCSSLISNQTNVFDLDEQLQRIENYLVDWKIERSSIESCNFAKSKGKITLSIAHTCDWDQHDENQLRYYHFLMELDNMNTIFFKFIKKQNLTTYNQKELLNWYQKLKFEISQTIYDVLKLNNLDLQDCKLEIKDRYTRRDYVITMLVNLEKLLQKIEDRYQQGIEKDFDVSSTWMDDNRLTIQKRIHFIETHLSPVPISASLKQVVFNALLEFKSNSLNNSMALSRYNFMVLFTFHLEKLLYDAKNSNSISEKSFIEFLVEMNFNHFQFLEWLANHFFQQADKQKDKKAKSRYYLNQLLVYGNLPVRIRSMYNESDIALKDHLIKIIQYELKYSNFEIIEKADPKADTTSKQKIRLKTSASLIIQLFRSMNENGFFQNASPTRIAEFVAENFNTNNVDQLSIDGVRNKFYNKDEQAKKELIILLQNVIASLKKD